MNVEVGGAVNRVALVQGVLPRGGSCFDYLCTGGGGGGGGR